ncbi:cytochrome P450 [Crossiella sp. CA198]
MRDNRFSRHLPEHHGQLAGPALRMSITEMDPPRHTEIRTLIGGAFSARRVETLRPVITAYAEVLLAKARGRGPAGDLLTEYCTPLAFAAQCELLGVPGHRRAAVRALAEARLRVAGRDPAATCLAELGLHAEIADLLADRQRPPTGLFADLLIAHRDGGLSHEDLTGLAASLFFDGHALSAAQIGHAALCLLRRPELWERLRTEPALLSGVVEETFRHSPAVNHTMSRVATTGLELGGRQVRAGDRVVAALPLANRDPTAIDDPDAFLATREHPRHLSFGHGTHHCLGAHLARVEVQVAMEVLLRTAPGLRLADPDVEPAQTVTPMMRALTALPVHW